MAHQSNSAVTLSQSVTRPKAAEFDAAEDTNPNAARREGKQWTKREPWGACAPTTLGMGLLHAVQGRGHPAAFERLRAAGDRRVHGGPAWDACLDGGAIHAAPRPGGGGLPVHVGAGPLRGRRPGWGKYQRDLAAHRNEQRWIEYAFSASLMVVLIAMITGIADIAALVALFGVNASMILFGWLQERYEEPGRARWWPFAFGCIAESSRGSRSGSTSSDPRPRCRASCTRYSCRCSCSSTRLH